MALLHLADRTPRQRVRRWSARLALAAAFAALAACGGGGGGSPTPAVAPAFTQQPAALSVVEGQPASFTVAASGTAPLSYQWQRNGVAIAAANAATYAIAATVPADNGAVFTAVVGNVAGSVTSNPATLTVTPAAPVLTVTTQPAAATVLAGTNASFGVAATCSSGTLGIEWQRNTPPSAAWVDIAGATASTYTFATVAGDNAALFRALLDCSGASRTPSNAAALTVTAPVQARLDLLPRVGLRDNAQIPDMTAIDQDAAGSYSFVTAHRIKRLSADLTTITPVVGGAQPGSADGVGADASFNQPQGLTQDAAGTIFVADTGNHTIRKVALDGTVSTLAGAAGVSGAVDGAGSAARFNAPWGITIGPDGDLYVSEYQNHRIRRVTPAGVVSTYAGSTGGFANGAALTAQFQFPKGLVVAPNGNVFVADYGNLRVRLIARAGNAAGAVSSFAGNGGASSASPDGIGVLAEIAFPSAMVLRGNTITVLDGYSLLRQIDTTSAAVTTLSGLRGVVGQTYSDGSATSARLRPAGGITGAPGGGFMLAQDIALRSVSAAGAVRTIAASGTTMIETTAAGIGTLLQLPVLQGGDTRQAVAVDPAGDVIFTDHTEKIVRRIAPSGAVSLVAGLAGSFDGLFRDGTGSEAQFVNLGPIASDAAGVLYVTDDYAIRRIGTDNKVTTLAGVAGVFDLVDGNAATARFNTPTSIVAKPDGTLFVADSGAIRRVDTAGNTSTYAGAFRQPGDVDGTAASARFLGPGTLALGPDGTLYVGSGSAIRTVSPDGSTVSRVAGVNDFVGGLAVDAAGTLYYGATAGLKMRSAAGTNTLLIAQGETVLGADPRLLVVTGVALLGPKQLVVQSHGELYKVTLP